MKNAKDNHLTDRLTASTEAKKTLLAAFRSAKEAAAPAQAEKQAERLALANARQARNDERKRLKAEEQERAAAAAAELAGAAEAAARAEAEARQAAENNRIQRVIEDEAARKAERDKRYADRKARKN